MDLSESYRELCETLPRSQGRIVTDNFTPSGRGNSSKSAGFIFYDMFAGTKIPGSTHDKVVWLKLPATRQGCSLNLARITDDCGHHLQPFGMV